MAAGKLTQSITETKLLAVLNAELPREFFEFSLDLFCKSESDDEIEIVAANIFDIVPGGESEDENEEILEEDPMDTTK